MSGELDMDACLCATPERGHEERCTAVEGPTELPRNSAPTDEGARLTEGEREALGGIVDRYDNDDQSLNDWHPCRGCPNPLPLGDWFDDEEAPTP